MSNAPPLPKIEGDLDLYLDVHTHKRLRGNAPPNDSYGDTDRLAVLGAKVLESVVTYHLFSDRRNSADEMKNKLIEFTSPIQLIEWLNTYSLREKLRVPPNESQEIIEDGAEMSQYFHTYIGALYIRSGLAPIQAWISGLIDPAVPVGLPESARAPPPQSGIHQQSSHFSYGFTQSAPAPPAGSPPPMPSSPPPASFPSSGAMSLVTLALVNQTAAQRGITVAYPAFQEGPSHQPLWTVRCLMNNQEKGLGQGKSQKIAKEEAARQAWQAMGWGPT